MTEKELKKLIRIDLLEMLLEQSQEVERLNTELEEAQNKLKDRKIELEEAGSIAEAALRLNGIFDMAQVAAGQYLENIESLSQRTDEICDRKRQECELEIQKKREETEKECAELSRKTISECEDMKKQTKELCEKRIKSVDTQVEEKWKVLSERLEQFCQAHQDVKELLSFVEKEDKADEA